MSDNHRFLERNKQVRIFFDKLAEKNPEWRMGALEKKTADQFYISERTVRSILKGSGIYQTA